MMVVGQLYFLGILLLSKLFSLAMLLVDKLLVLGSLPVYKRLLPGTVPVETLLSLALLVGTLHIIGLAGRPSLFHRLSFNRLLVGWLFWSHRLMFLGKLLLLDRRWWFGKLSLSRCCLKNYWSTTIGGSCMEV